MPAAGASATTSTSRQGSTCCALGCGDR